MLRFYMSTLYHYDCSNVTKKKKLFRTVLLLSDAIAFNTHQTSWNAFYSLKSPFELRQPFQHLPTQTTLADTHPPIQQQLQPPHT